MIQPKIADCEVNKVLIDTGSSVNLIFQSNLENMHLSYCKVKTSVTPLRRFAGSNIMTIRTVKMSVYIGQMTRIVKFFVIFKSTIYNIIFGTSWIHSIKAVASTYH